ncbi:MAG: diguanylate cyclase [Eubacterium sp.]
MKTNKMKFSKNSIKIVCALIIIVIIIGTVYDFSYRLQHVLTNETYRTLSDVSKDYNKAFLDRIDYNVKTLNVLAGSLEEMQGQTKEEIIRVLQNAVEDGGFEKIVACDMDGKSYSDKGIFADVSQRDYFQKAMKGEKNISEPLASLVSGEESLVIAVPIHDKTEIKGVLLGVYPLSTAGEQLLNFTYYSEGYGFIVASDGTIIISSDHADKLADEQNIFSFFEKTDIVDFSVEELKKTMEKGENANFAFNYKNEKRFVSFMPSTVNDWYTFSIASDEPMMQQKKIMNRIVLRFVLQLFVVGMLLLIWFIIDNRRHNKEIRIANQKYQSLLDNINGGMIVAVHAQNIDETIITHVSSGFTDMTGYTIDDIKNNFQGRYLNVILEEDRQEAFDIYLEQIKTGTTYHMPYRIRKKDGLILWVMDNGYLVNDIDGWRNHSIVTDITVIKKQEEELRLSEERFSLAINASSGTLFEVDLKRKLYTHFENSERIFGINAEKLLEDTRAFSFLPYDEFVKAVTNYFFHPDDHIVSRNAMEQLLKNGKESYEARLRRFDNSYIWARIDLSLSFDENGEKSRLIGFMSDIDNVKKRAELLENKVQTDPMTGLYNKVAMATLANKVLEDYPNGRHALIVLDIDNFKGINDTLGHAFGDVVLIEVCTKLKHLFRNNDIVGRMGGDEFAVLMKNVPDTSGVLKKAMELSSVFRQTYVGEKEDYKISCSMGIIMIENNNSKFEVFYRRADAALYQAKQNGKDQFILYNEEDADQYPINDTRTNDEEAYNHKTSHNIEAHIFELLYTSKDFNVSINMALAAIGQQYQVSRVAIFENNEENNTTTNIYEWCNDGITSEMGNLQNLAVSSSEGESIFDPFDQEGLLYCSNVHELAPYLRHIFESQGILSTLQITITDDEKTYGFIGFDECKKYRVWTSEEMEKLSYLSKLLSVFLFKEKAKSTVMANLNTRLQILDVLPDYMCVVNPETHSIVYANKKMTEIFPEVQLGSFCFTKLHGGQTEPCAKCIIEQIKKGDTDHLEIVNEAKDIHLKINALSINWTDDKKMMLLYGIDD